MMNTADWQPLSEALKTRSFEELLEGLRNGAVKGRGDFDTDSLFQQREDGVIASDMDGNFRKNIREITTDDWQHYKYEPTLGLLTNYFTNSHGSNGYHSYSDIEVSTTIPLCASKATPPAKRKSKRESELHREIGEAFHELQNNSPTTKVSATMVWNYLKKSDLSKSCIISFGMDKVSGEGLIEWRSSNGATPIMKRLSFNNVVSDYARNKKKV